MKFLTADRLADLNDGLPAMADADFVWARHDSPLGPLMLVTRHEALVRVAFAVENFEAVLDDLGTRWGTRTLNAGSDTDDVRRQLDEYFAGTRRQFDVPVAFDLTPGGFRRQVQEHLVDIGYGHTASYAEVAESAGNPKAVRAVGTACSSNPLPIVVPCHRVVRSDGSYGNYLGGKAAKTYLLEHERRVAQDKLATAT